MMAYNMNEAEIRDALALDLGVIEHGFKLVEKEYFLPNLFGSRGYIDILAKDRFNNFVIIEVKRSNQTAREAIHEIFKYASLLRQNHGIKKQNIRCIIVSTEWRELMAPFSELKRSSDYSIEGYLVNYEKNSIKCAPVVEIDESEDLEFCPSHLVYFYETPDSALEDIPKIKSSIQNQIHKDFLIIGMVYCGNSDMVIYPYCNYLIQRNLYAKEKDKIREHFSLDEIQESEGSESYYESEIWCRFNGSIRDDAEAGYPEKFHAMLYQYNWKIAGIIRLGCFEGFPATNEEIAKNIMGLDGDNSDKFIATMSPRFKSQWNDLKNKMGKCLFSNPVWRNKIEDILYDVESNRLNSTVSISIFNPCNILMQLVATHVREGDKKQWLPKVEIVIDDPLRNEQIFYEGILRWNGVPPSDSANKMIECIFGENEDLMTKIAIGMVYEDEYKFTSWLGLEYDIINCVTNDDIPLDSKTRNLNVELNVEDFVNENYAWVDGAVALVRSFSYGI